MTAVKFKLGGLLEFEEEDDEIVALVTVIYRDFTLTARGDHMAYTLASGMQIHVKVAYVDAAEGRQGAVTVVGPIAAGLSSNCLEFRREWSDAAHKVVSRGLACRSDSGDWSVLSMPPKPAS